MLSNHHSLYMDLYDHWTHEEVMVHYHFGYLYDTFGCVPHSQSHLWTSSRKKHILPKVPPLQLDRSDEVDRDWHAARESHSYIESDDVHPRLISGELGRTSAGSTLKKSPRHPRTGFKIISVYYMTMCCIGLGQIEYRKLLNWVLDGLEPWLMLKQPNIIQHHPTSSTIIQHHPTSSNTIQHRIPSGDLT